MCCDLLRKNCFSNQLRVLKSFYNHVQWAYDLHVAIGYKIITKVTYCCISEDQYICSVFNKTLEGDYYQDIYYMLYKQKHSD